jgi:hypothetical protein
VLIGGLVFQRLHVELDKARNGLFLLFTFERKYRLLAAVKSETEKAIYDYVLS